VLVVVRLFFFDHFCFSGNLIPSSACGLRPPLSAFGRASLEKIFFEFSFPKSG
jgi:hypothetical protein